jgi:hypothetical protein
VFVRACYENVSIENEKTSTHIADRCAHFRFQPPAPHAGKRWALRTRALIRRLMTLISHISALLCRCGTCIISLPTDVPCRATTWLFCWPGEILIQLHHFLLLVPSQRRRRQNLCWQPQDGPHLPFEMGLNSHTISPSMSPAANFEWGVTGFDGAKARWKNIMGMYIFRGFSHNSLTEEMRKWTKDD